MRIERHCTSLQAMPFRQRERVVDECLMTAMNAVEVADGECSACATRLDGRRAWLGHGRRGFTTFALGGLLGAYPSGATCQKPSRLHSFRDTRFAKLTQRLATCRADQ